MMKKIRLWKMIALTIITFGIYGVVWLARRRNEMVQNYKFSVPHWLWLVVPSAVVIGLILPLTLITYGVSGKVESTALIVTGILILGSLIAYGISLWWIWKFGEAVEKITDGRVPVAWTFIYWFFGASIIIFVHQYYFNRAPKTINKDAKTKHSPSPKFIAFSVVVLILAIALSLLGTVLSIATDSDWSDFQTESKQIDDRGAEANRLLEEYNDCIEELDAKYPGELTPENEKAYMTDYDTCEEIRIQQNAKADEHNNAIEKL